LTDECDCKSCADRCEPETCPNGKCRATGQCIDQPALPGLAFVDAPSIVPTPRRIVGFTGLAGSGKSTAATHLIEKHGYTRGKFAGALKEMCRALLRYRGVGPLVIERMIEGDLKELPTPYLNGKSPRHAMQTLGTEWGRVCIADTLWIDTEMDSKAHAPALVFDDVRYPNEAEAIIAAGGTVVRIDRPDAGASTPGHSSETGVASLPVSLVLRNNSRLEQLLADVSYIFGSTHPD
jgi:hypothetical protein